MFVRYTFAVLIGIAIGILFQSRYGLHHLLVDLGVRDIEFSNVKNRSLSDESTTSNPLVLLVFGQSNVANSVSTLSLSSPSIHNFYEGELYEAKDPLLGATGKLGSIWISVAERLLESTSKDSVVLINMARGNTSIADWTSGKYSDLFARIYAESQYAGYSPDVVVWGQGERDAIDGMSNAIYSENMKRLIVEVQSLHKDKPILLSLTSKCFNTPASEQIRAAQLLAIKSSSSVFVGPDTDELNNNYRYDGCHFNELGKIALSEQWAKHISHVVNR